MRRGRIGVAAGPDRMTEDEVLAVHESAHAAFAVFGQWTRLAGPVVLKDRGCGDVVMGTDVEAIRRILRADPGFDRDLPRIELVRALLAGPAAERRLARDGRATLSEEDLSDSSSNDYEVAVGQLRALDPPRPDLLAALEREVRQRLDEPAIWSAVERFAAVLAERRSLGADEATAILEAIRASTPAFPARAGRRNGGRLCFARAASVFWAALRGRSRNRK